MTRIKNLYTTDYKVPEKYMGHIENAGKSIKLEYEEVLYEMCESASDVFFVKNGIVESACLYENGRKLLIDTYSKSSFFGYAETLSGQMRATKIMAIEDTELIKIAKEVFLNLLFSDNALGTLLVSKIANDARTLTTRLGNSNCLPPKDIVIRDILDRLWYHNQGRDVFVPARKLWAGYLGITRETLARVLSEIQRNGWIEITNANGVLVKDIDSLSAFSEYGDATLRTKL